MKKILNILASTTLIASTAFSVTSCQKKSQDKEEEKPIFPFPEYPTNVDEVQEFIGYYYDLGVAYTEAYTNEDFPMPMIESENFQKGRINYFIGWECFEYIGYQLGQRGGFHFITPNGFNYSGFETNKEELDKQYKSFGEKDPDCSNWAKDEMTKWYNWTLKFEK